MPHFTVGQWAPVDNLDKVLPVAFIVMAVDLLESTSIARLVGGDLLTFCLCLQP